MHQKISQMKHSDRPIINLVIRLLLRTMALLPLPVAHSCGTLIGLAMWKFSKGSRKITLRNIELCFPELPIDKQRQLAKQNMIETGKTITELGALWFWPFAKTLALVKQISGREIADRALAQGRGVIFVSPHLGAWELSGLYCNTLGDMTSLYRPPKLKELDELIRHARERSGATLVATDSKGVRTLFQRLKQGGITGILPDQDPGFGNGEFAPFFGIQAKTMTLLSKLAFKNRVPVVLIYSERLAQGEGFHIHFLPIELDYKSDTQASLVTLNKAVEQAIRQCPSQYQWGYKRFKSRPEGEPPIY
jgi:KDO2-lipid IV(A) lauroyltransferase